MAILVDGYDGDGRITPVGLIDEDFERELGWYEKVSGDVIHCNCIFSYETLINCKIRSSRPCFRNVGVLFLKCSNIASLSSL